MGVTNGCGHAKGGHEAVKFERRDQAAFDMQVGVNKTGNEGKARYIDDQSAIVISAGSYDRVPTNGHITGQHLACNDVKHLPATQNQIGRHIATPL